MRGEAQSKRPESEAEQHPKNSQRLKKPRHIILPDRFKLAIFQGKSTQGNRRNPWHRDNSKVSQEGTVSSFTAPVETNLDSFQGCEAFGNRMINDRQEGFYLFQRIYYLHYNREIGRQAENLGSMHSTMCAETLQSTQDSGSRQSLLPCFTHNPFVKRDTFVFIGFANKDSQ